MLSSINHLAISIHIKSLEGVAYSFDKAVAPPSLRAPITLELDVNFDWDE